MGARPLISAQGPSLLAFARPSQAPRRPSVSAEPSAPGPPPLRRFLSHGFRSRLPRTGRGRPLPSLWGRGGRGVRLSVWPCWYPSCSREYDSWESSVCVCVQACRWRARCVSLNNVGAPLCLGWLAWTECVLGGRVYTRLPWVV